MLAAGVFPWEQVAKGQIKPDLSQSLLNRLSPEHWNNGYIEHPAGNSVISALFEGFQWCSMRKYILKHTQMANTFDTKNDITHLYFILGTAKLHWNLSSWLRDAPDIYRFPVEHKMNLWICENFLLHTDGI